MFIGYCHPALYERLYEPVISILRAPPELVGVLAEEVLTPALIDDLMNLWISEVARNCYLQRLFANAPSMFRFLTGLVVVGPGVNDER